MKGGNKISYFRNIFYSFYIYRYMENEFRRTAATVSMINYHFVFCPHYRRKIFLIDGVENRFKELVYQICQQNNLIIIAMECHIDHCHLFINAPPKISPSDIMKLIKGKTAKILREEFPKLNKMKTLWTRSYFVSTAGNVSTEAVKHYVETQKTRS